MIVFGSSSEFLMSIAKDSKKFKIIKIFKESIDDVLSQILYAFLISHTYIEFFIVQQIFQAFWQ